MNFVSTFPITIELNPNIKQDTLARLDRMIETLRRKHEKETKEKDESKEPSLEDVDAKLKSIIDNPDLNF